MSSTDSQFDRNLAQELGSAYICGIDEVGRGSLAGPVVAACVMLDYDKIPQDLVDSKKLSPRRREQIGETIRKQAKATAIGVVEAQVIDRINIRQASLLAMKQALLAMLDLTSDGNIPTPDCAFIDGRDTPEGLPISGHTIIGGDNLSPAIAAASIIAKVERDAIMRKLAIAFPHYGWKRNVGYGTEEHMTALQKFGVSIHHRRSFAPVRRQLAAG